MKTSRIVILMTALMLIAAMLFSACQGKAAEPTGTKPPETEPSQAEPSQAEPSQAEPSQAEPSQAEPSQAEPSQAEPTEPATAEGTTAAELYEAVAAKASFPEMMSVSGDMILDFYGIAPETYTDGVAYMSIDNLLADEAAIFIASDEASAESIETMLKARQQMKADEAKGYSSEQYKIITESGVIRNGLYVAMIVTGNYAPAAEAYNGLTAK